MSLHRVGPASHAPVRFGRPVAFRASAQSETIELATEQDERGAAWVVVRRWALGATEGQVVWRLRPSEATDLADAIRRVLHNTQGRR